MNQSQALDDTSAALALIDRWLRAHLPALDAEDDRSYARAPNETLDPLTKPHIDGLSAARWRA